MSVISRRGFAMVFFCSLVSSLIACGLLATALSQPMRMLDEREYRKERRKAKRTEQEYESIRANLVSGDTPFSTTETSHDLSKKFFKFSIVCAESGERKDCYLRRYSTSLKKTLDSLSRGDALIVRGKNEAYENKEKSQRKVLTLELHTLSSIFVVDQIKRTDD